MESDIMYVIDEVERFQRTVIYNYIRKHTLERYPMNVIHVVNPFHMSVVSKHVKELTLERDTMHVGSVVKPFQNAVYSKYIKEYIPERNITVGGNADHLSLGLHRCPVHACLGVVRVT